MKKLIVLLLFALLCFPMLLFAQSTGDPGNPVTLGSLTTFAGVVAVTLVITGWIKTFFTLEGKWARWLSWGVSVILSILCWYWNLGIFEPLNFFVTLLYGFGIGLVSNGVYTSETVQGWLEEIGAQIKKE